MKTYLIAYDLHKPGRDYAVLHNKIKELANGWWHHLESVWLINTNAGAAAIRDALGAVLDSNDELVVIRVGTNWATLNIGAKGNGWLRNNLKGQSLAA